MTEIVLEVVLGALQFLQAILNVFFCNDVGDLALWES